jgi:hypothetical protein
MAAVGDFSGIGKFDLGFGQRMAGMDGCGMWRASRRLVEAKTDGAGLERLGRTPCSMAVLASSGTCFFSSAFAAS